MPTSYPGALDSLTNPTSNDTLAAVSHSSQHANANDAIEAIEARSGIGTKPVFDVVDYGATGASAAADTAGINSAITAANAAGGGVVVINNDYSISSSITIASGVAISSLAGIGRNNREMATLTLANGVNASMFYIPLATYGWSIGGGLSLRGNSANQTGTSHGIEMVDGDGVAGSDARHVGPAIHNLLIKDFETNGIYGGRSSAGMMIDGVMVQSCGQDGIRLAGDTDMLNNSLLTDCGRYGLVLDGPSASISNFAIWENLIGVRLNAAGALGSGAENTQFSNGSIDDNDEEGEWIEDNVYWTSHTNIHYHHNSKVATGLHAHVYYAGSSFATTPSFGGCKFFGAASPTTEYDYEIASATGFIREDATTIHYGYYTTGVSNRIGNIHQTVLGELLPSQYSNDTAGAVIRTRKSRHVKPNQHTTVNANDVLLDQIMQGSDGTTFRTAGLQRWQVDSTPSSGIVPGRYSIYTADSAGTLTLRSQWDSTGKQYMGDSTSPSRSSGSGSPENAVTAVVGSIYHRTDGSAGTSFYVKESGSGNTGWVAK